MLLNFYDKANFEKESIAWKWGNKHCRINYFLWRKFILDKLHRIYERYERLICIAFLCFLPKCLGEKRKFWVVLQRKEFYRESSTKSGCHLSEICIRGAAVLMKNRQICCLCMRIRGESNSPRFNHFWV